MTIANNWGLTKKLMPIALLGSLLTLALWLLVTGRLDDYCYDLLLDDRCRNLVLGERNSVSWTDADGNGHTIFWIRSSGGLSKLPTAQPFPVEDLPDGFRRQIVTIPQEVLDQLPEDVRQHYLENVDSIENDEQ